VVCDEPTSAQDPATIGPLMGALLNCEFDPAPGRPPVKCTVIAITHNVETSMRFQKICVVGPDNYCSTRGQGEIIYTWTYISISPDRYCSPCYRMII
jgi:ABC-type transporter Mla maintaining outer membrane lipid asymmetry ATPase subunit MlaF